MTSRTFLRSLSAGLAAALLGTGCSPDRATAPNGDAPSVAASMNGSFLTTTPTTPGTTVPVVQRDKPLRRDATASQTITSRGGELHLGAAGLTLYFAPGAVSKPLLVTATAYAGSSIAYSFEPHGTVFHAPVYVVQDLDATTLKHDIGLASTIAGAYMPDGFADLNPDGTAVVSELHDAVVDKGRDFLGKLILKDAVFEIQHFSGYILTGGRR